MLILYIYLFIFALEIVPNNALNIYFMVKSFKQVIQVFLVVYGKILKGRFDFLCDGTLYHGYSKDSVFALLGSSVTCVQLCIPFVFD